MKLAPIALFTYNRPWHTRQTVEALHRNELASESDLYIFSDAAKDGDGKEAVAEVRRYIHEINGFNSVTLIERESNLGLANSIISGVTEVLERYGRIIVIEDDLMTSTYFLRFMNDGLNAYKDDDRVINIHAYTLPLNEDVPETFFLRGGGCWGWATWKRGWDLFDPDGASLLEALKRKGLMKRFDLKGGYAYTKMLRAQVNGRIDSWAIRWHASAFLKDKLSLYPGRSLVSNIGLDNSGTHCGDAVYFQTHVDDTRVRVGGIDVCENQHMLSCYERYYKLVNKKVRTSRIKRGISKIIGFGSKTGN